jgi:hypothetical protein
MPRYFFHVKDGVDQPDLTGTELRDDATARLQAIITSTRVIGELGDKFWNSGEWQMRVETEDRSVATLHFTGTITDLRQR